MGLSSGLWVRVELRRRRRALLALSVLCAFVFAVALTAVAGARRTTTAYARFSEQVNGAHADVQMIAGLRGRSDIDLGNGTTAEDVIAALRRLPQVEALSRGAALQLGPDGIDFYTAVSVEDRTVNRFRLVDGRLPEGLDEVALSRGAAKVLQKGVGDEIEMQGTDPRQAERLMMEGDTSVLQEAPDGPRFVFRVAGVVEGGGDIGSVDLSGPYGVASAEFYARHRDAIAQFGPVVEVRLRNGFDDVPALRAEVERLTGGSEYVSVEDNTIEVDSVNDAVDTQALALLLFAVIAAAAGLVGVGTAVTRQLTASGADAQILRALGLTRWQRTAAFATVASPVIIVGVALGFLGAVAASPLLPMGLAGRAEPNPGLAFDAVALPLGAIVLALVLASIIGVSAWDASRTDGARERDRSVRQDLGLVNRWVSMAGLGAVGATGLRLAFDPGPRTKPAPTRAALTAAIFATGAVSGVLVLGASLANVVAKPSLSGFPWDAVAGGGSSVEDAGETVDKLMGDPDVAAVTVGYVSETTVEGERTQVLATQLAKGGVGLTLLDGRAPFAPDEVAVGPKTLKRLPERGANPLELSTEDGGTRSYRIVGTAALPILNYPDYDDGIWMPLEALTELAVASGNSVVLVTLADGVDVGAKRSELEELGFDFESTGAPARVANLDDVDGFPQALAAFLAVLGLVTVGHALVTSPRRRRRELAVLRTLGLVRRQVGATLAVQATAVSAVGLLVGLPIGIAGGRTLWGLVANGMSVVSQPVVPLSVLLVAPVALVVANLMAVLPARRAAGIRPAEILRAE